MVVSLDMTQVLVAIVSAFSAITLAYVASLNGRARRVGEKLDTVEKTVNHNYQEMTRDLRKSNDLLAEAALQIATLTEKARGSDIATARSQGLSEGILLPAPGATPPATVNVAPVINGGQAPVPVEVVATVPVPVSTEAERGVSPVLPPPPDRKGEPPPPR